MGMGSLLDTGEARRLHPSGYPLVGLDVLRSGPAAPSRMSATRPTVGPPTHHTGVSVVMSVRRPRRRLASLCAVTTIAGSGLAGLVTSPAEADPPGPDHGIATVGECRTYTYDQAMQMSEDSAPVDCTTSHTAQVLATPHLPDGMGWDATEQGVQARYRVMARACYPAFQAHLGRTESLRHKSAYTMMWFEPTAAQKERGARWLRCDLVLQRRQSLRTLADATAPVLHRAPLPHREARCETGTHVRTTCDSRHRWRATGTYLVRQDTYPRRRAFIRLADQKCPRRTSSRDWFARWSSRVMWRAGDHMIVCFSKTRR